MGQPVVHYEIGCKDSAKLQAFYSKLFDWKINEMGPAAMIDTGAGTGISGHITSLGHEPHNYVAFYVQVDDLQAFLDKAAQIGAKILIPPTEIPGAGGSFAWLTDPEGTVVGLLKPPAKP